MSPDVRHVEFAVDDKTFTGSITEGRAFLWLTDNQCTDNELDRATFTASDEDGNRPERHDTASGENC